LTEQANAAPAASEAAPVVASPNLEGGESFTAEQAFEAYQSKRNPPAASADDATAGTESAVEADAGPEEAPGETQEAEAAEPPIERPKSWAKDEDTEWQSLPRATQQKIVARELERDKGTTRSQQEAAEARKAADAELVKARELTKALSAKLPELETAAQEFFENKYPEFKTYDDVVNMARQADALSESDPFTALQLGNRVKAWEADQNRISQKLSAAREAKASEAKVEQAEFAQFVSDENMKLPKYVSEADIKTFTAKAPEFFDDLGFSNEERIAIANGKKFSPFDARFQRMAFEAMKYREMIAAPAKAIPKPVPSVQKPGVGRAPGAANADAIQATRSKLSSTGSAEDAYALYQAKKARAR
jgi:hypothetical protein